MVCARVCTCVRVCARVSGLSVCAAGVICVNVCVRAWSAARLCRGVIVGCVCLSLSVFAHKRTHISCEPKACLCGPSTLHARVPKDFHLCCHGVFVFQFFVTHCTKKCEGPGAQKTSRLKLVHVGPDVGPCLAVVGSCSGP